MGFDKEDSNDRAASAAGSPSAHAAERASNGPAANSVNARMAFDLEKELTDAEHLLKYAAAAGIEIDENVRKDLIDSTSVRSSWTVEDADKLLVALTRLSFLLRPVSGESLRRCAVNKEAARTIRLYRYITSGLGVFVVVYSIAAYIATTTCELIRKDINTANGLAVTLGVLTWPAVPAKQSATPAPAQTAAAEPQALSEDELTKLQQFATLIRDIERRAISLSKFGPHHLAEPDEKLAYQLPPPPFNATDEIKRGIGEYQGVRFRAQAVEEKVSEWFGAITTCLLPTLYALLGTCAYLTRLFEDQLVARTFTGLDKPTARFLIAGIAGMVVGLFGGFGSGGSAILPPLGIAFLAGYGVDVFFFFLDGILQTFRRSREPGSAPAPRTDVPPSPRAGG